MPATKKIGEVKSSRDLVTFVNDNKLGKVDSREWTSEWDTRWVVYADLIAFAERAKRSSDVVLNNIVRFDRASNLVKMRFPNVEMYRFSDATFGIASTFYDALSFAISMHHCCLAMNVEYLSDNGKGLFIHTIVPRITMAQGHVLQLPEKFPEESRFNALTPRSVLAGEGIVAAYALEKFSAAGLLTFGIEYVDELLRLGMRGDNKTVRSTFVKWASSLEQLNSQLFVRGKFIDFPWMLFRPFQKTTNELWCESRDEVDRVIEWFAGVWELSAREYYSPQCSSMRLEPMKHYCAAVRHAIHCSQLRAGQLNRKYFTPGEAMKLLSSLDET